MSCQLKVHQWGQGSVPVIALHSSGLSGLQWRRLAEKLGPEYSLQAPDFWGYGGSPESAQGLDFSYLEDLREVLKLLEASSEPCVLLGHSYGGFIALKAALARPQEVLGLCLYEPVVWGGLASFRRQNILEVVTGFDPEGILLDKSLAGTERYLQAFVDYWNGPGTWEQMTPLQRSPMMQSAQKIAAEVYEVVTDPTPHTDYASLRAPLHLLHGTASPKEVLEMKDLLLKTVNQSTSACIPGGHMNPIRNPIPVNAHFQLFLDKVRSQHF